MRLLLVEDHVPLADELLAGLSRQGYAVDWLADGRDAAVQGASEPYDLIILDLGLPGRPGLDVLREWRGLGLATPVLILTARGSWAERIDGLKAGADDYLTKPFDLRELAARLHALLRRAAGRTTHLIDHGPLQYDPTTCAVSLCGQPIDLSRREQALLQALLQNPGRILSSEHLKDSVYGLDDEVESNALNVHIHHLRRKLGNGIVETVRGLGYRLGPAGHEEQQP